jgi:hypothetical protein
MELEMRAEFIGRGWNVKEAFAISGEHQHHLAVQPGIEVNNKD